MLQIDAIFLIADIRFKPVFDRSQSDQATEGFGASSLDGTALASNAGGRSSGGVEAFEFLAPPTGKLSLFVASHIFYL
jgi:hypothetical protein